VIFTIISIIAFFLGLIVRSQYSAWTIEDLIEKIDNVILIDKTIISLYQKKMELYIKTPELKQIPSAVNVKISNCEITNGKIKDKENTRRIK
jgi:hypothetical protein